MAWWVYGCTYITRIPTFDSNRNHGTEWVLTTDANRINKSETESVSLFLYYVSIKYLLVIKKGCPMGNLKSI